MAISPSLHFPLLSESQVAKEVTVNTALLRFEAATQNSLSINGALGNVTLTNAQSVEYGRYRVAGNTVAITVTIPQLFTDGLPIERVFLIDNRSAFSVTLAGSVSGSVVVPANFAALAYINGTVVELMRLATDVPTVANLDDVGNVDLSTPPTNNQALAWNSTSSTWSAASFLSSLPPITLDSLSDVVSASPTNGQSLIYNTTASRWEPGTPSSVAASLDTLTDVNLSVAPTNGQTLIYDSATSHWLAGDVTAPVTLDALSDVDLTTAPTTGQALVYNGTVWVAATASGPTPVTGTPVIVDATIARTIGATEADSLIKFTSASNTVVTLPLEATVSLPVGHTVTLLRAAAATLTVTPEAGVTIISVGGKNKATSQYSAMTVVKTATNEWLLAGDISV